MFEHILVDARFGVVSSIRERRSSPDALNVIDTVSLLDAKGIGGFSPSKVNGGGNANRELSYLAAIGEALERYSLAQYDANTMVYCPAADLPHSHPDEDALRFFLDEQYQHPDFPIKRFKDSQPINWVPATSLSSQAAVFIPASLTYLPYRYVAGEPALSYQLSPGTSSHVSYHAAANRAILEIIERDALTIMWEGQVGFPRIDPGLVHEKVMSLSRRPMPLEVQCFDITTDLDVPSVFAMAISRHCEPEVAVGSASSLDPATALCKAIDEAITSWRSSVNLVGHRSNSSSAVGAEEVWGSDPRFEQHALYHARKGSLGNFKFLLSNNAISRRGDGTPYDAWDEVSRYEALRDRVRQAGQDIALVDITCPENAEIGFVTVRAVGLGLVRQSLGVVRHLRNPRILSVPKRLELHAGCRNIKDLIAHKVPAP